MLDYHLMDAPRLVREYNTLVDRLKEWPETSHHTHVAKFRDKQVAVARCVAMATIIKQKETWDVAPKPQAAQAPKPEAKPKPERTEPTIKELTAQFNELVPKAVALGLKEKHHTSDFGDRAGANKQLKRITDAIAEAEKAKAAADKKK